MINQCAYIINTKLIVSVFVADLIAKKLKDIKELNTENNTFVDREKKDGEQKECHTIDIIYFILLLSKNEENSKNIYDNIFENTRNNNYNHTIIIGPNKRNNFTNNCQKNNIFKKEENKNESNLIKKQKNYPTNNDTDFAKKQYHMDISH